MELIIKYILLLIVFPVLTYANTDRILIEEGFTKEEILEKIQQLPQGKAKFAISGSTLAISTTSKKKPRHDDLAIYGAVKSGGYITFEFDDNQIRIVKVDNYSGRLCPQFSTLLEIFDFLAPILVKGTNLILSNNPNYKKCEL